MKGSGHGRRAAISRENRKTRGMTSPPESRTSYGLCSAGTVSKLIGRTRTWVWTLSHTQYLCPILARWTMATLHHQAWCCNPGIREIPAERDALSGRGRKWLQEREAWAGVHKSVPTHKHLKCWFYFISKFVFLDVAPTASSLKVFYVPWILGEISASVAIVYVVFVLILGTYTSLLFNIALNIFGILLL